MTEEYPREEYPREGRRATDSVFVPSDVVYQHGAQLASLEARMCAVEGQYRTIRSDLESMRRWVISTLGAAVGSLLLLIYYTLQ